MHKIIGLLLLCSGIQVSLAQEQLNEKEARAFKQRIIKTVGNTQTIVSDFTQYKHLDFLANDIKTVGKLVFKTPNSVKWQYTSPYRYSAIFKNDSLFINDGGDKSNIDIGANKIFKNLNTLIINSVKGNMFDENEFSITYFKSKDGYIVKFIPKNKNMRTYISIFELTFNKDTNDVVEVKMTEPSKNYTKIIFNNKKRNTAVNDAVFNH